MINRHAPGVLQSEQGKAKKFTFTWLPDEYGIMLRELSTHHGHIVVLVNKISDKNSEDVPKIRNIEGTFH